MLGQGVKQISAHKIPSLRNTLNIRRKWPKFLDLVRFTIFGFLTNIFINNKTRTIGRAICFHSPLTTYCSLHPSILEVLLRQCVLERKWLKRISRVLQDKLSSCAEYLGFTSPKRINLTWFVMDFRPGQQLRRENRLDSWEGIILAAQSQPDHHLCRQLVIRSWELELGVLADQGYFRRVKLTLLLSSWTNERWSKMAAIIFIFPSARVVPLFEREITLV